MRSMTRIFPLLALVAALSSAADERPVIRVNFIFHGNTCSNYGATRTSEAERFGQDVARTFESYFPFAHWQTNGTKQPGEKPEATLTVQFRAKDERVGPHSGKAYYLDYFRDVQMNGANTSDRDMSTYIGGKEPLYEWDSFERPCGQDPKFTQKLTTRIENDIKIFRPEWMADFLRYVPIGKEVPNPDEEHPLAVTLPLHWKPLHAGTTSQLELNVGGDTKAVLKPIGIHDIHQNDPLICATVVSLRDAAAVTKDTIRTMLQNARSNAYIRLFMVGYELRRDTPNFQPVGIQVVP